MSEPSLSPEEIETEIIQYLKSLLENPPARLHAGTGLVGNGLLDSVQILDLIEFIEKTFSVTLNDADMVPGHFEKIGSVVALVRNKLAASTN